MEQHLKSLPSYSILSDVGEEFFVIDELKNSQNRIEEVDEVPVPHNCRKMKTRPVLAKSLEQVVDLSSAIVSEKALSEQTDMDVQQRMHRKSKRLWTKCQPVLNAQRRKRTTFQMPMC